MATTFYSATATTEVAPLTTIFTPPSWCASQLYTSAPQSSIVSGLDVYVRDWGSGTPGAGSFSSCWPPYFSDHHVTGVIATYSPGVCPEGYAGEITFYTSALTSVICCPPNMEFVASLLYCTSTVITPTVVAVNPSLTSSISSYFIAGVWPVHVQWAASDLSLFTPASAPLLQQSSASATSPTPGSSASQPSKTPSSTTSQPTRTSQSAPTNTTEKKSSAPRLSAGTDAGIGVGAAVGALLVIGAVVFFCRRRRRKAYYPQTSKDERYPSPPQQGYTWPATEADSTPRPKYAHEMTQDHWYEADDSHRRHEADGTPHRSELPGDDPR